MPNAEQIIAALGPVIRDRAHLRTILKKLRPTQRKMVFAKLRPLLQFDCPDYRKVMNA